MTMVATAPISGADETVLKAPRPLSVALVAVTSLAIGVVALVLPAWPAGDDMGSTHYMGLLAANQPWNLLLFMAVPVILAETIAVTELAILFRRQVPAAVVALNRYAGLVAGFYFLGVLVYLLKHAVVPLTTGGGWRGPADLVAVGFYLLGIVPLYGLTLLETRVLGAGWDAERRLKAHATFVGIFLVVAHVAMIAGMLDPSVLGWNPAHVMDNGTTMPGMDM
jgi:hypothetical protein